MSNAADRPNQDPLQLSLFDMAPESPGPGPLPGVRPVGSGMTVGSGAVGPVPAPPDVRRFVHPAGQREVRLQNCTVVYRLRRARRKSIGFVVGLDGLTVSAPRWVSLSQLDDALREKAHWILSKLHQQAERERRIQARSITWGDGAQLPFLGEMLVLVVDPRFGGVVLGEPSNALPGVATRQLHVGVPAGAGPLQVREAVQSWLQAEAMRHFQLRCDEFSARLGVLMTRLKLSSASTRWGSASADGTIRLNWRLIHFAPDVIDYVVVHELAHLREMNHSSAFWQIVRTAVPEFARARASLQHEALPQLD